MKRILLLIISALILLSPRAFSQHSGPTDQSKCLGDTALLIVEHSFDFVTFTWEQSTNNINFEQIDVSEAYNGIDKDTLYIYTGLLNPSGSGIWRYYRCHMTSTITGVNYSDTAYLAINIPPSVDFTWTNPCQGQSVHFESIVSSDISPNSFTYTWTFGDGTGTSVYPDPYYVYAAEGAFNVTLMVEDDNGCSNSITKNVLIHNIPSLEITGKDVVCSNEQNVEYSVDLEGSDIKYKWDISGLGTIDNDTSRVININWYAVDSPSQNKIYLTITILFPDNLFCSSKISKEVLITTYEAPPVGIVFRKPYNSSLLIYKGPEVNSYKWGYTEISSGNDFYIPASKGGERLYCDFGELKSTNTYWVETSYDSRINCVTRSYFESGQFKIDQTDDPVAFKIYPVPASDNLKIQADPFHKTTGVVIYNLMMQEVLSNMKMMPSEDVCNINLEGLKSGVYIIQITDESGMNHFRVFNIEK